MKNKRYEVWLLGYNHDKTANDIEQLIGVYPTESKAVSVAMNVMQKPLKDTMYFPNYCNLPNNGYVTVCVEHCENDEVVDRIEVGDIPKH